MCTEPYQAPQCLPESISLLNRYETTKMFVDLAYHNKNRNFSVNISKSDGYKFGRYGVGSNQSELLVEVSSLKSFFGKNITMTTKDDCAPCLGKYFVPNFNQTS